MDLELAATSKKIEKPKLVSVKVYILDIKYNKFRNYSNEVDSLKKKFLVLQDKYINRRNLESLSFDSIDSDINLKQQRKNLIDDDNESWGGQESINQMKRETYRIEDMGNNINRNLNDQTGQMKHINQELFDIELNVEQSDSLLKKMLMRENRNKLILVVALCIGFISLFAFLIYNMTRN